MWIMEPVSLNCHNGIFVVDETVSFLLVLCSDVSVSSWNRDSLKKMLIFHDLLVNLYDLISCEED